MIGHGELESLRNSHLGFMRYSADVVLKKFGLLSQRLRVALAACRKTATRTIRSIGSPLFALFIVVCIREIHPQAAVVPQGPPHLVENIQQVPDKIVRMFFMSQLAVPMVRPSSRGAIPALQVKGRGGQADLDSFRFDCSETVDCIGVEDSDGIVRILCDSLLNSRCATSFHSSGSIADALNGVNAARFSSKRP